jgi:hypothetical protein
VSRAAGIPVVHGGEDVKVLEVTEAALRPKMDGDLGEMKATLNAHTRSMQALHDTQSDHTRRLTRIEDDVRSIKVDVGRLKEHAGSVQDQLRDVRIGLRRRSPIRAGPTPLRSSVCLAQHWPSYAPLWYVLQGPQSEPSAEIWIAASALPTGSNVASEPQMGALICQ